MADRTIGELPVASQLDDESLLVVEQQAQAKSIKGRLVKEFAQASVYRYVESAKSAAEDAAQSASSSAESAEDAAYSALKAAESAKSAEQYSGNPPIIQGGTWWTWNAAKQEYEDTGEAARGNVMFATFYIDVDTGDLFMITPDEYMGPNFLINEDGHLEVSINA